MASGKAKWIDEMVLAMMSSLLQLVKEGKQGENGFKKEAWRLWLWGVWRWMRL